MQNIILRKANQTDAVYLHKYRSESGENITVEQVAEQLEDDQKFQQYMIELDGAVIGDIHYGEIDGNCVEIGVYIRDESCRGQGFGSHAILKLAEKIFAKNYDAIVLNTAVENMAMRNIAEKKLNLTSEIIEDAYQVQSGTRESYAHYVWCRTANWCGKTATASTTVTNANTARAVGSGSLDVFATPMMIALMEQAACACLTLETGQTSVGTALNIEHTTASPVGANITASAKITSVVDGRKIEFSVTASDGVSEIGHGTHTRVIVDETRFMAKTGARRE